MSPTACNICAQPNKSSRSISRHRRWGGNSWDTSNLKPPRNATHASWKDGEWKKTSELMRTHTSHHWWDNHVPTHPLLFLSISNDASCLATPGQPFWNKLWLTAGTAGSPRGQATCPTFSNVTLDWLTYPSLHVWVQPSRNYISTQDQLGIQVRTRPVLKPLLYVNSRQSLVMLWRVFMSIPCFWSFQGRSSPDLLPPI